jgi:MFS family permease
MSSNVGVAVGPAVGGLLAATSYTLAFIIAAGAFWLNAANIAIFTRETLPVRMHVASEKGGIFSQYQRVTQDKHFLSFIAAIILTTICAAMMWVLLGVYAKKGFNIPENQYGWIATTNALMVITLQFLVTQQTKKHEPMRVMAVGGLLYAVGVGSVALGQGFWAFWLSMVVMTCGELILVPTATTYAANLAPVDMRGRYMGVYNLTWGVAAGIGPILGGVLNDTLGGQTIWIGAALIGLAGVGRYLALARQKVSSRNFDSPRNL